MSGQKNLALMPLTNSQGLGARIYDLELIKNVA